MVNSDGKEAGMLLPILQQAYKQYPKHAELPAAIIKVSEQALYLLVNQQFVKEYSVSTSRYGTGQEENTYKTPLGVHCVQEKIGESIQPCEIFLSREPSGEIACIEHEEKSTDQEFITSRILWLSGLEPGVNQGQNTNGICVDSYQRYIYIHGTHEEGLIGKTASIGCVRMKNEDVIELFDNLVKSSLVIIEP